MTEHVVQISSPVSNGGGFVWNGNPKENCHGFRGKTQMFARVVYSSERCLRCGDCTSPDCSDCSVLRTAGLGTWSSCQMYVALARWMLCIVFLFFLDSTVVSTCAQYLYQKLDWWAAVCLFWEELNSVFFVCSHTTDLRTLKIYQKYLLKYLLCVVGVA